jgi:toxin ParE1/3/4
MTIPLFLRVEAEADLQEAFEWYEECREGLGVEYLDCVNAALEQVRLYPPQSPVVYGEFRRIVVKRFPFGVFYTVDPDRILVYAVFHLKRDSTAVFQRI